MYTCFRSKTMTGNLLILGILLSMTGSFARGDSCPAPNGASNAVTQKFNEWISHPSYASLGVDYQNRIAGSTVLDISLAEHTGGLGVTRHRNRREYESSQ